MGMVFEARMLDAATAAGVREDDDLLERVLFEDDPEPGRFVDLDKAWHGIHWLLSGTPWEASSPQGWAILGGAEVGEDNGYGPARLLEPAAVAQVARALTDLPAATLADRMDRTAMAAADLYPSIWDETDVFEQYLGPAYERLRAFYLDAAVGDAWVLLSIC